MAETEEISFSIDSRLLEELGENLVTRNHVAMAELIKNSYDADATSVKIEFEGAKEEDTTNSEIRVVDDGVGMTAESVRDDWFRIATTDKIRNPRTEKFGRQKAGDKGIGRFACRRLAHVLDLESIAYREDLEVYERTSLTIDWREYEKDQQIEEVGIPVEVEREPSDADLETGVTLRLRDLQETWTERDFNTLRRNVISLAVVDSQDRGDQYDTDPGFEIQLEAPEFSKGEGTLSEQIHEAGWGCLTGKIDHQGDVELELEANTIGEREYRISSSVQGLDNTSFKISYIPQKREHFRDTQTLSSQRAAEIKENHGGVRVYSGGFRVFSYGGPENDWLRIDEYAARRRTRPDQRLDDLSGSIQLHDSYERTMLVHPQNNQLVGRVMISSDADLTMQSNREGFVDNNLFEKLKDIIRLSLQWMTLQYSHYLSVKKKQELKEKVDEFRSNVDNTAKSTSDTSSQSSGSSSVSSGDEVEKALNVIEQASNNASGSASDEDAPVPKDTVEKASNVIQTTVEQKEREIDFFRSAFSVNQVVFGFTHELRSMVNNLGTSANRIENVIEDLPEDHQDRFSNISADLRDMQDRFEEQMELFGIFMETSDRKQTEQHPVKEIANDIASATAFICEYYDVELTIDVSPTLLTPHMFESELYSILLNLTTNGIKAIGAASVNDGEISINGKSLDDGIALRVCDNGVGIPEGYQDEVVKPLVSDPGDNMYEDLSEGMPEQLSEQVGKGSGLGLSIVKNIAEKYDGDVQFVDDSSWSTCVEVTLYE